MMMTNSSGGSWRQVIWLGLKVSITE